MRSKENLLAEQFSIVEAIEVLSSIAALELDSPIAVSQTHEVTVQNTPISYRSVHWLHKKNAAKVVSVVKDTFRVVLNYLKNFYKHEVGHHAHHESAESIQIIMSLVGEAAKKLDKFSEFLSQGTHSSIKESKEFRELLAFYKRKIAPIAHTEPLAQWMQTLPIKAVLDSTKQAAALKTLKMKTREESQEGGDKSAIQHVFIDLDSVKNDSDYELFLIRKGDGSRFFNLRLLRSVKLVSNFDEYFNEEGVIDVYTDLRACQDNQARLTARNIAKRHWHEISDYLKDAPTFSDNDMAMVLYRSIIALLLATQEAVQKSVLRKSAFGYFADFQKFLRGLVTSHDYQKNVTYPQKNDEAVGFKVIHLVQGFIRTLFEADNISKELIVFVDSLIDAGKTEVPQQEIELHLKKPPLSYNLALDYEALLYGAKPYSHTPLAKVLDALQDLDISGYDPLLLQNIPSHLFSLDYPGKNVSVMRLPTPTSQDYINKACVTEEFKGFIRGLSEEKPSRKQLVFNLQERTSWREFARCMCLEELQRKEEFKNHLCVVTVTKDSDFYHQTGPYQELNQADIFIEQLIEHVSGEGTGYAFPEKIHTKLFPKWAYELAGHIHELFFASRNVLTRSSRADFIEIFYLLLELKIIEVVAPNSISMTCKDALDIGMPATCELFFFLKLINDRPLSSEEVDFMKVLLFGLPLILRGRNLFSERFTRMNSLLKVVESTIDDAGIKEFMKSFSDKIGTLYDSKILNATLKL